MSDLVNTRLGSGSDYAVFLHHLGIPVADLTFAGPYGVYHSIYDNHQWVARFGDPGFRYHAAMTRLWGLVALRLANADVLPFDFATYADALAEFVDDAARGIGPATDSVAILGPLRLAIDRFRTAAAMLDQRTSGIGETAGEQRINSALMQVERAFIDEAGLPDRPWYKHTVFAPEYSYAPMVLPGLTSAIETGDRARMEDASRRLADVIDRAAALLDAAK
jgi:N-acetylated-alpha-linked acidic dipeptidase